ncbi:DapH/DapD/GlmU-related protein [Clostridium nigeriense]|uniref:DapH/DapD/GlmU-related protein n=1 Tax=Clostridium nigeriense TaxID=1805470 RepID=UPI003D3357E3
MKIKSCEILQELNYEDVYINYEFEIQGVSTLSYIKKNTIVFINKYNDELIDKINTFNDLFILLKEEYKDKINYNNNVYVFVKNPRYEYAKLIDYIISKEENDYKLRESNGSYIAYNSQIDPSVKIEPGVFIGPNVTIGKGTKILSGAKIKGNVKIGENCIIRENCVIGGYGFGFDKDYEGKNFRIPHLGGVIIGNNVEVGAITTVCSGTINPTILEDYVKVDDHVHVAHNVVIGENSIITACAEISGSCIIGKNVWLAPNTSIINGIKIGDNVTIGMGAVVTKSVSDNEVMVGAPAEPLEEAKKFKKIKEKMIR